MSERIALLYEVGSSGTLIDSMAEVLARAGLSLAHPESGQAVVLDQEGEQSLASAAELRRLLEETGTVRFQWWFAKDHDVYCRVRREGDLHVIELGLEGSNATERALVGEVLQERFKAGNEASVGLVLDPEGVTEDYDWDRFFISREILDWSAVDLGFPDVLGVQRQDWDRLRNLPDHVRVVRVGSLVMAFLPHQPAER
ncbi:hypothetical protein [Archangium violaceum]|uniref:hypothetical protein n=1 Tax=Archangium violaceum TaxID=83451 RepID=UPI0036DBA83C